MRACEKCGQPADNETILADDDSWDFCSNCMSLLYQNSRIYL